MASPAAIARLRKEFKRLEQDPVAHISAQPSESNILEWHYLIHGPPNSPYHNGLYHGKLVFPRDYPYRPPAIYMITPNGRFKTNTKLCLSMSDFHPETWNPLWSVSSILQGLLSFMIEDTATSHNSAHRQQPAEQRIMKYGSMDSTTSVREELARRSEDWNVDNDAVFNNLWPDYKEKVEKRRKAEKEQRDRRKANGEDEAAEKAATGSATKGEEATKEPTPQEPRNGAGGGGGGGGHRGRLPLGMDKLMAAVALASVAFGVAVLYTYH